MAKQPTSFLQRLDELLKGKDEYRRKLLNVVRYKRIVISLSLIHICYSSIEESIDQRLLKSSGNYEESICRLLSKAYVASLFEIIYCNYDFETARNVLVHWKNSLYQKTFPVRR